MTSGLVYVSQNYTYNFIDEPEDFLQYHSWLLREQKGTNIQTNPTQFGNTQLYGVSNYHMFTEITMCTYIRPVK